MAKVPFMVGLILMQLHFCSNMEKKFFYILFTIYKQNKKINKKSRGRRNGAPGKAKLEHDQTEYLSEYIEIL